VKHGTRNEPIRLKEKLLTLDEKMELTELLMGSEVLYRDILHPNKKIEGVGIHNIDDGSSGRVSNYLAVRKLGSELI
jgi:hypothetical protein